MRSMMMIIGLVAASGVSAASDLKPCLSCHSPQSQTPAPLLDGQQRSYLLNQLSRFRDHVRESFPMEGLSQGLDEAAAGRLADAFSQRPWFDYDGRIDSAEIAAGAGLIEQNDCRACHGEAFRGSGDIPRLAGQRPDYLARQIQAFAADQRFHPPTGEGGRMYQFDAEAAAAIGAWLAAKR